MAATNTRRDIMFTTRFTPPPRKLTALAAALVALLVAGQVWGQTTGTISAVADGFTFPMTATLNSNREWEFAYTADISNNIPTSISVCDIDSSVLDKSVCFIDAPYIMKFGQLNRSACFAMPPQSAISGINGRIPFASWQQTLRARPDTSYCIAIYASNPMSYFYNVPFASAAFTTPADPNPPASPAWTPNPFNTGCGTETTLALVRQCFQCKGGGGSWSMSADTCGN